MKYLLVILILFPLISHAERKDVTGKIGDVRYHDAAGTLAPSWNGGVWFQLTEASENFCVDNKVSIKGGNDIAISILLAAKISDKTVLVTIDDIIKYPAGAYCRLQYITIK